MKNNWIESVSSLDLSFEPPTTSNVFQDYILVEFENEQSAYDMMSSADHFETENIPLETRVLYFVNPGLDESSQPTVPVKFEGPRGVQLTDLQNASTVSTEYLLRSSNRSGQVWGHTPEQRVAASTLRR